MSRTLWVYIIRNLLNIICSIQWEASQRFYWTHRTILLKSWREGWRTLRSVLDGIYLLPIFQGSLDYSSFFARCFYSSEASVIVRELQRSSLTVTLQIWILTDSSLVADLWLCPSLLWLQPLPQQQPLLNNVPAYTYEISALIKVMYIQTVSVHNLHPFALSKMEKLLDVIACRFLFGTFGMFSTI
jgi:hypothetical protein